MKTLITAVFLIFLSSIVMSKNVNKPVSITGKIIDSKTKAPLEFASVAIFKLPDSVLVGGSITDSNGEFVLDGLNSGKYCIVASFIGYKTRHLSNIEINSIINIGYIELDEDVVQLGLAEATADKNTIEYKIDRQVINPSQILASSNGTAIDVLKQSPSVSIDNDDNVSLRGSQDFILIIDNKPVQSNKTEMLKQISASQIDKIEVITNPSSKYDASSSSGIISIKTIRTGNNWSGMLNLRAGTGNKCNTDAVLRNKSNKFSFQISGNANKNDFHSDLANNWNMKRSDSLRSIENKVDRNVYRYTASIRPEIEYELSKKTNISVNGAYNRFQFDRRMDTDYKSIFNTSSSLSSSEDVFYLGANHYDAGIFYRTSFDTTAHNLEITGFYMLWNGINDEKVNRFQKPSNYQEDVLSLQRKYFEVHKMQEHRWKIDYQNVLFNNISTEMGMQSHVRIYVCNKDLSNKDLSTGSWNNIPLYSGNHNLRESTQSAYFAAGQESKNYGIKAGIRVEYYDRYTDIPEQKLSIHLKQINWFPSLHMSLKSEKGNQWQISYSRRISPPNDWVTSPVPFFDDGVIILSGNPALKPELFNLAELNHIHYFGQNLVSLSFFSRYTENAIERILVKNSTGQIVSFPENLADKFYIGLEAGCQFSFFKYFLLNFSMNGYSLNSKINYNQVSYSNSQFTFNGRASIQYKIGKTTRFEINGRYMGQENEAQGRRDAIFQSDLSFRQSFLKNKFSATITFNDFLATNEYTYREDNSNFSSVMNFRPEYPMITLGITYRFNDFKPSNRQNIETNGLQNI